MFKALRATAYFFKTCLQFLAALLLAPVRPQASELRAAYSQGRSPRAAVDPRLALGVLVTLLVLFCASMAHAVTPVNVPVSNINRTGVTQTAIVMDPSNGNKILLQSDGVWLAFANPSTGGGAANTTITATDYLVNDQGITSDAVIYAVAGKTTYSGPWKTSRWKDSNGYMQIMATGVTTTTIQAFRLPIGQPDSQTR